MIKIEVGGWYKWGRLHAKKRLGVFHELVRLSGPDSPYIGWTGCGIPLPKPKYCQKIQGPVYGGEEKPCQNCIRARDRTVDKKLKAAGKTG